jgi:hypothetical protein
VSAANGGFSVQQPIITNPANGITSGGNVFKAGQQGVTLGNVGVGDSIQARAASREGPARSGPTQGPTRSGPMHMHTTRA